jgi:hypothetical protein
VGRSHEQQFLSKRLARLEETSSARLQTTLREERSLHMFRDVRARGEQGWGR